MSRLYTVFSILILVLVGLFLGNCSRSQSPESKEAVSAAEQNKEENDRKETISAAPQNSGSRIVPSEDRLQTQPASAAFFAAKDMGFSEEAPLVFDNEIGHLRRRIPESLDVCLSNLGGNLPAEYIAPRWREHVNRQSKLFGGPPEWYRLAAEGEGQVLTTRFKAVWNEKMLIGFLRARMEPDGRYLLEDLGILNILEKPYSSMEIPPPLIDPVY